ncbi:unnamed protein product [Penicillium camemberti]|uniref:Str. FM013 n=1 Tax=Penicillium camemberti (strain FM 013) TaxID=1429867 RepID=A0A0G4P306_PENC3|nr:unnamed protein product [Penicillium camemberti]
MLSSITNKLTVTSSTFTGARFMGNARSSALLGKVTEERLILTPGDGDLDDLTYLRVHGINRAERHRRIVENTSQLLNEAQTVLLQFSDPYQPPASNLLWDIQARMEVLVDEFLGVLVEEAEDRAFEEQIWARLS